MALGVPYIFIASNTCDNNNNKKKNTIVYSGEYRVEPEAFVAKQRNYSIEEQALLPHVLY